MKRLRDTKAVPGTAEALLVEVIKSTAPVEISPAAQRRVLERVLERQRRRGMGVSMLLRPVVVMVVLLAAGVAAAGVFGHNWIARGLQTFRGAPPELAAAPPVPAARPRSAPVALREEAEPSAVEPVAIPAPAAPVATRPAPKSAVRTRATKTEDPSLVVDALRALRNDHDAQRASTLLASYLRIYPRGALSEEALALSIEAADARKSPRAAVFAEQYLKEYPSGRFRRTAEQGLGQRQP